jgi:putative FmdB family regulatory protein
MPIYEYQCEDCCHTFEMLMFGSDDEPGVCPKCNNGKIKRLMSCACFIGGSTDGTCAPAPSGGFS